MTDPIRILFVDNQVDAREWLAERLRRKYAFEVDCADNGEQALACVAMAQNVYDVVLLDMRLGQGPDGIEVMKSLQSAHPGVEVIIVTGFGDVEDGVRAMQQGACNYVFKPWRDEELVVYIRAAADRRRLKAIERERDWLQNILSVSQAMTQSLDPEQVAREICERVACLIPNLKLFYIASYDESREEANFLWAVDAEKRVEMLPRVLAERKAWGLAGHVIKTKKPIIVSDLDEVEELRSVRLDLLGRPARACISIPLISRDNVIGVLSAQSQQPGVFTRDHLHLLQAIANQTAVAIDNAVQHQQTALRLETLSRLYKTLATMRTALRLDDVLSLIVDNLHDLFRLDTCTVGLFDRDLVKIEFVAERGLGVKVERKLKDLPKDIRELVFAASNPVEVLDLDQRPDLRALLVRPDFKSFVLLPLHGKSQEPLGIVTMGSKKTLALSEEQKDLLRALADQAAIAIENARLHEEVQAWAQQLERLDQVSRDIANEIEITQLLRTVASKATEFLGAAGSGVYLLREDNQQFQLAAATGQIGGIEGVSLPVDKGIIGRVLQDKKPIRVDNYWQWPDRLNVLDNKRQTAVIGVPIFSGTEILGVLVVHDVTDGRTFSTVEEDLLSRMGRLAGAEIEKAQIMAKNEMLLQERDANNDVTQTLVSVLYYDQLLKTILKKLQQRFGYHTCAILLKDSKTNELYIEGAIGYPEEIVRTYRTKIDGSERGVTAWVARNGKSKIVSDVSNEPLFFRSVPKSNSEIAVPLFYGGKVIGVLNVESTELSAFSERDERILTQAAAFIAIAIKNAQLYDQAAKKTKALRRLNEVGRTIQSTLELEQVLDKIANYCRELLNAEVCSVFHVRRKGFLRLEANVGSPPGSVHLGLELEIKGGNGVGLTGAIAKVGKMVNLHGEQLRQHPAIRQHEPQAYIPRGITHAMMAIPLKQRTGDVEEVIGLIKVENKKDRNGQVDSHRAFDNQDGLILRILADYAETAIRNARLFTQTKDKLTAAKSAAISLAATSAWAHDAANDTYVLHCDAENLIEHLKGVPGLNPRVQQAVKRIGAKAEKVAALIPNTPPDLSQKEPMYIGKVLHEVIERRESKLREQGVELDARLDDLPPVLANKQALYEVCDNLIRNAIRAMPNGGQISFLGRVAEEKLLVEITDTGVGVLRWSSAWGTPVGNLK
jgi:GAF domain-containing protein/ActR/RegA family two-component response regulator